MSPTVNSIRSRDYLGDIFARLPSLSGESPEYLDELLPDRWLAAHPQHRWEIDKIRRVERQQRKQTLRARK